MHLVAGAQVFENTTDVSSYSYDSAKKELVSYDTPNIVKIKTQYINSKGLGGSMFWEVSGPFLSATICDILTNALKAFYR